MSTTNNTSSTQVTKNTPVAKGNNSPFIVVRTSNGTTTRPNPKYQPAKKTFLQKLFGG